MTRRGDTFVHWAILLSSELGWAWQLPDTLRLGLFRHLHRCFKLTLSSMDWGSLTLSHLQACSSC